MKIGILSILISVSASFSLKDKRRVVKSLLDIIRNKYNVSAAEIDYLDSWRQAGIGFAAISNDSAVVHKVLNKIMEYIESNPEIEVLDSRIEEL